MSFFQRITGWVFHRQLQRESGEVYMDRYQPLKTRLLSIYINVIRTPDYDEWLHNHPWEKSWSLKLWNNYVEEVPRLELIEEIGDHAFFRETLYRSRQIPSRFSRIPELHRIIKFLRPGPCITLFIGWKSSDKWGFQNPETGEIMPWRDRLMMRRIDTEQPK